MKQGNKQAVKKVFFCLMAAMLGLFSLAGCRDSYMKSYPSVSNEDFIFLLEEEEEYAILFEIREAGAQKEVLKVPAFIEGYPVRQIGVELTMGKHPSLKSENTKKIYLPYTASLLYGDRALSEISKGQELIAICDEIVTGQSFESNSYSYWMTSPINTFVYTQNHFDLAGKKPNTDFEFSMTYLPNYIFHFNYPDSPNSDTFWIDYITADNLKAMPDEPTREGYEFGGWYAEPECLQEWDREFSVPGEGETFEFYAKWIPVEQEL